MVAGNSTTATNALLHELARELMPLLLADLRAVAGPALIAPRLLDVEAAAKYLGRSVGSVREMAKKGVLPATRLDGRLQFDRRQLDRLIEEKTL